MRLITLVLLVLLPFNAVAGVIFEDNFNGQVDWKNTCRTCGKTYTGYSGAGAEDGIPVGWSYWRADEHWNPDDATVPTPNSKPVMRITNEVDAQGSGKAFIFTNESEDDSPEDSGGWSSDGELSVALPQDYNELYFQFRVKFAPNFARYYTSANPTMIKFFRVYHWDRNGSPYAYFSSGTAAPIALPKAVQNEYGAAFGNDAIRCDPQATNYGCDQNYSAAKAFFVSNSCGAVSYPTNAPPYTDISSLGLFDSQWHTVQIRVKLNSAPGVNDGLYTIWQDGCLVKALTNVQWIGTGGDINAGWNFVSIGGNAFNNWLGITNNVYRDGAEQWYAIDDVVVSTTQLPLDYVIGGNKTYYVNVDAGDDSNDGLSPQSAWKTVAKVNTVDFVAGDTIRFASGDYGTTILTPKTSGSIDSLITFTSYVGDATKPILRGGINLNDKNYIKIEGFDINSTGNAILIGNGSYNVVNDNTLYSSATSWVHAVQIRNGSHYNKITNNTIGQASGNNDIINLRNDADNNLIENNVITINNSHAAIDLEGYTLDNGATPVGDRSSNYNIVRGNTITGINGGGALINLNANSNYNVVDNNTLKGDNSLNFYCDLTSQPALHQDMFKLVGSYNIARNNKISSYPCKDSMGIDMSPYIYDGFTNNSTYQHVYHNVITGIGVGATPLYLFGHNGGEMHSNVIKNNIIYNNGGTYWQPDNTDPLPTDTVNLQLRDSHSSSFFTNNLIWKSGYSDALVWLGDNRYTVVQADINSNNWNGNLSADPLLDNSFLPQTGSPVLNAGADLTTITSASGTGTSFVVADPYYFTDGNGITTGDVIEVNNQTTTITDINYATGLLTVSPSIIWTQGMVVNLPFDGIAPSIGLYVAQSTLPVEPTTSSTPRVRGKGYFKAR